MPRLQSITLLIDDSLLHGAPWEALEAILSVPHLRELSLVGIHPSPVKLPLDDFVFRASSHLTTFRYKHTGKAHDIY